LDSGVARLTPLYDVIPTVAWPGLDTDAGMSINAKSDISNWRTADLIEEATVWGLPRKVATATTEQVVDDLVQAFDPVADRVGLPDQIREVVQAQLERLTQ